MEEAKEFLILRYSLIKENHGNLDYREMPKIKGSCVSDILKEDYEFKKKKARYSFLGFTSISSENNHFESDRFWVGKIAKHHRVNLGEKIPGDIVTKEEDDWIALWVILDSYNQYIIVNKDFRFGKPEQVISAFQEGLSKQILKHYNHKIFVEGVIKKDIFWQIVHRHNRIYNLQLKLVSPNILQTNVNAHDALEDLQKAFRQEEVEIRLSNTNGELVIPKDLTSDYIDYIENGEGSWCLKTEDEENPHKRKVHSSADHIQTISLSTIPSDDTLNGDLFLDPEKSKIASISDVKTKITYEVFRCLSILNTWT